MIKTRFGKLGNRFANAYYRSYEIFIGSKHSATIGKLFEQSIYYFIARQSFALIVCFTLLFTLRIPILCYVYVRDKRLVPSTYICFLYLFITILIYYTIFICYYITSYILKCYRYNHDTLITALTKFQRRTYAQRVRYNQPKRNLPGKHSNTFTSVKYIIERLDVRIRKSEFQR